MISRKDTSTINKIASSYDYILVGAGSAGSVLAYELTRLNAGSVLTIELGLRAGHRQSRRPALYPHLFQNPMVSHVDRTVPQCNLAGRSILLPSGKGLGGSTLINAMILLRPHAADLLRWYQLLGNNWHPELMSQLLDYLEEKIIPSLDSAPYLHPISKMILHHMDLNSPPNPITPFRRFTRAGRRESIWRTIRHTGLLEKIDVLRGATVNSVGFSGDRASGVNLSSPPNKTEITIHAHKAVILCAGALKTPTILMKSGIGPKESILPHRSLIYDAPRVGENLSDHLVFPISLKYPEESLPSRFDEEHQRQWLLHGTGPLASNIAELGAFGFHEPPSNYNLATNTHNNAPHFQWHITPTHYLEYPTKEPATNAVSIGVTLLHPESRGSIQWTKDGTFQIDPNYLSTPYDRLEFVRVVQWTRKWIENCPWRSLLSEELIPGTRRSSDESVEATIRRLASTIYHYAGTCAVGKAEDSVCDPFFQVRGCHGLYVCDGSSMPQQVSGNPQVSIMVMAVKLARMLAGAL